MSDREIFDTSVPVFLDWQDTKVVGEAQAFQDQETGIVSVNITYTEDASKDLMGIFDMVSTKAISFAGPPKQQPVIMSDLEESMSRHPAGKKRVKPTKDICGAWADDHTTLTCEMPKGHSGPHERPRR